jgi:hypothetical protein
MFFPKKIFITAANILVLGGATAIISVGRNI